MGSGDFVQKVPKATRQCEICPEIFSTKRATKKYCSQRCASRAYNEKRGFIPAYSSVSSGTVGAIGELRVCVDLMSKGLDVFRSQSPNAKSDLIFIVGRLCYRVEVKTGYRNKLTGEIFMPRPRFAFDVLAVALPNEIVYLDCNRQPIDVMKFIPEQHT